MIHKRITSGVSLGERDAPTGASADASANAPTGASADASANAPTGASADASANAPTGASADAPTGASADAPTGASADAPTGASDFATAVQGIELAPGGPPHEGFTGGAPGDAVGHDRRAGAAEPPAGGDRATHVRPEERAQPESETGRCELLLERVITCGSPETASVSDADRYGAMIVERPPQARGLSSQIAPGRTDTSWPSWMHLKPYVSGVGLVQIHEFIDRWRNTRGERANKDSYLKELCRVLGLPEPDGKTGVPERDAYVFEADAVLFDEDGRRHVGKMDLYRRDSFVLEAKQAPGSAKWGSPGWNLAMTEAAYQAFAYARTLDEPPPFVIVADIGRCFDIYACFDGTAAYRAFPNSQKHRLWLKELDKHADFFRKIWFDPMALDPRRYSERVMTCPAFSGPAET